MVLKTACKDNKSNNLSIVILLNIVII